MSRSVKKSKSEYWEKFKIPTDYSALKDEEVIEKLAFVRDVALCDLVEKYKDRPPVIKGSLALLEVINRCHMQMKYAYEIQGYSKGKNDADGFVIDFELERAREDIDSESDAVEA